MSMTNKEVCHAFVHQHENKRTGRVEGKNGKGSVYYSGGTIYSYGSHYVLGRVIMLKRPIGAYDRVVVCSTRQFSISTSAHQRDLYSAIDRESMIEVRVEDAEKFVFDPSKTKDVINLIHTMALDEERNLLEGARHGHLFDLSQFTAVRGKARLLTLVFNAHRCKITKEAQELITRIMDPELESRLLAESAKAREDREAKARQKQLNRAIKFVGELIAELRSGDPKNVDLRDVLRLLKTNELDAQHSEELRAAATEYVSIVTQRTVEAAAMIRNSSTVYSKLIMPLKNVRIPYVRKIAIELQMPTEVFDTYFDTLLEGAKLHYTSIAANGNSDYRHYPDLLHEHFGLLDGDVISYAFGGGKPSVDAADSVTFNSSNLPNAVVYLLPDGQRIRTTLQVEIGMHEFKRYCTIIRALYEDTMSVADIPEGLRRLQGGWTIHSYNRETDIIVVGCHRMLMRNILMIADKVCG